MLTKVDELNLPAHHYLDPHDDCYFIGEYTAGRGYAHSNTNDLISNLKKGIERRGLAEYRYKEEAIVRAAVELRASLNTDFLQRGTFVPIPPSKRRDDPLYDDRMSRIIRQLGPNVDLREVVYQAQSTTPDHLSAGRLGPAAHYANYLIDRTLIEPTPISIAVVDDVLTSGAHSKAIKKILLETFPDTKVVGVFLARRVPNTE
jgi:predicted amidophosphoribosyltransferase